MLMNNTLLEVTDLKTWFQQGEKTIRAVDGVSFSIKKGETFALLGESGCGKSMTALSVMRLVPSPAGRIVSGAIKLNGTELLCTPETAMRKIRGGRIAMIFQEPMTSLNPVLTVGEQIRESVILHKGLKGSVAKTSALELLDAVGIPDPGRRYTEYPHQLSGGMKQRIMIAIALAGDPELLIADEPTTALDVTIQAQVLTLLEDIQKKTGMAILLITHDLGVVSEMVDRVAVMYAGQIIEVAPRNAFFAEPKHPYTKKLFESLPSMGKRGQPLAVIRGSVPVLSQEFSGCRFAPRCDFVIDACKEFVPDWIEFGNRRVRCHLEDKKIVGKMALIDEPVNTGVGGVISNDDEEQKSKKTCNQAVQVSLLAARELKIHFAMQSGFFKKRVNSVKAVDGVSLDLNIGQTIALVGESGCGKTTVAKGILQLEKLTSGSIAFNNQDLSTLSTVALKKYRGDVQIIFQDPFSSMNPRMKVCDIISEGMIAQNIKTGVKEREEYIDELLKLVGLPVEVKYRYPHEFSGGQRQRICIARALAVNPKLIVCDEPTSALDVSVQAQILNLLKKLQSEMGLAYLFITHNISVVEYLADEVAVMYLGRIVEQGRVEEILKTPKHPYTEALLSAVPKIDEDTDRKVIRLEGELPSPVNRPEGCHFHPRCKKVMDDCKKRYPTKRNLSESRWVSCYLY